MASKVSAIVLSLQLVLATPSFQSGITARSWASGGLQAQSAICSVHPLSELPADILPASGVCLAVDWELAGKRLSAAYGEDCGDRLLAVLNVLAVSNILDKAKVSRWLRGSNEDVRENFRDMYTLAGTHTCAQPPSMASAVARWHRM